MRKNALGTFVDESELAQQTEKTSVLQFRGKLVLKVLDTTR